MSDEKSCEQHGAYGASFPGCPSCFVEAHMSEDLAPGLLRAAEMAEEEAGRTYWGDEVALAMEALSARLRAEAGEESAVGLIGQICEASETRHDLIHGFVVSHNLAQSVETKMSRILWHEAKPRLKNFTVTARRAMEHAAAVNRLANQFLSIATAIVDGLE